MDTAGAKKKTLDMSGLLDIVHSFEDANNCKAVIVNADYVTGERHLLSAYEHALRGFGSGSNRTKDVAMETLLYVTGDRQISRALKKAGKIDGAKELAILVTDGDIDTLISALGCERDDSLLSLSIEKLDRLGITEAERATVPEDRWGDLALERVALFDVLN